MKTIKSWTNTGNSKLCLEFSVFIYHSFHTASLGWKSRLNTGQFGIWASFELVLSTLTRILSISTHAFISKYQLAWITQLYHQNEDVAQASPHFHHERADELSEVRDQCHLVVCVCIIGAEEKSSSTWGSRNKLLHILQSGDVTWSRDSHSGH